jgi:hypothetical protein
MSFSPAGFPTVRRNVPTLAALQRPVRELHLLLPAHFRALATVVYNEHSFGALDQELERPLETVRFRLRCEEALEPELTE